ncbi:hypothetical protein Btru_058076 [Bulinus truncatus]|nr:hypothetical protein Btru_058076 [Bulinus truncatus]
MLNKKKATKAKEAYSKKLQDSSDTSGEKSSGNESERIFPFSEQRLYVINRSGTGDVSYLLVKENFSAVLSYRVHADKWQQTVDLVDFGVVTLGKYIYVIGGLHKLRKVCVDRVLRFDPATATWTECCCLLAARSKFGVCTLRGKIYVCGGEKDGGKTTSSCEMFDPETNSWTKCGMLLQPRSSPACVAYGDTIICAGGCYNEKAHNNFWIYERHKWQEMDQHYPLRLPYSLQRCAVVHAQSTMYFIGGASSKMQKGLDNAGEETPLEMAITERRMFSYSTRVSAGDAPDKGQQLDMITPWSFKLPPLLYARQNAGAVIVGQNIHVIGGTTVESGDTITVPERFDLVRGEWTRDMPLKNCDVSNVICFLMEVPKVPMSERKLMQNRLKWVMW